MNSRSRYGLINHTGVAALFLIGAMLLALGTKAQTWQRSATQFSVTGKTVQGVAVADLNGDGAGDIVLSIDHNTLVYIGDGKGYFKLNADVGKSLASASIQAFVLGTFSASGEIDLLALTSQPSKQAFNLVLYRGDGHGGFASGAVLNDPSLPALDDSCSLNTGSLFKHPGALNDYVLFCNSSPSLIYVGVNAGNGSFTVNSQAAPFRSATMRDFTADLLGKGVDGAGFFDSARAHTNPYASILYFDTPQSATVSVVAFPGAQIARVARYDGEQYPSLVGVDGGVLYSQHGIEGGFGDRKTIDAAAGGVQDIALGHLQAIPGDPALDIVLASVSDGQIQIQPYVNTARTQVVVKQGQKRQSSISMNVKVVPFTGNTIPLAPSATDDVHALALSQQSSAAVVGSVSISVDGRAPESVSVDEQGADFSTTASTGTHQTITSFAGDDVHAASLIAKPMVTGTNNAVFISKVSVSGTTVTITAQDSCTDDAAEHSFEAVITGPTTDGSSCSGPVKEGGTNGAGSCSISGLEGGSFTAEIQSSTDTGCDIDTTPTAFTVASTKTTPSISVSCSPNNVPFEASGTSSAALTTCTATVGATGSTANVTFTSPQISTFSSTSALSGGRASFSGFSAGTAPESFTITATFAGDANFNATSASTTFTVIKATPSISLSCSPNPVAFVAAGTESASVSLTTCTASVGAPGSTAAVSFSENGNIFTAPALSNDTATASGFSPGTTPQSFSMLASFAGDGNYNAVSAATTFTIVKATPTVTVSCLPSPATFSSSGATVATCTATVSNGATGTVTFSGSGVSSNIALSSGVASLPGFQGFAPTTEAITASYSGDGNNNGASGTGTLTIIQAPQTITFTAPASTVTFGAAAIGLSASASSGLAVSFTSSGACSVSGSTLSFTGGGACTVTASQAGNTDYTAAASVSHAITVDPASQTITFTAPPSQVTLGSAAIGLSASATSGLAVSFSASGACSVSGSTLSFTATGACSVTASQAGNANFSAATSVTNAITVDSESQTITFTQPTSPVTFGASAIGLSASASSGLAVSFAPSGACSVSGSTLTFTAAGACTVTASQAGNASFSAATSVARAITISPATPALSASCTPNPVTFGATYTCTATVSGGVSPTGTVTWPSIVGGSTTTLAGGATSISEPATASPGSFSGTATYNGNANNSAATATVSIAVSAAAATISISNIPSGVVFGQSFAPTFAYSGTGSPTESVTSNTPAVCAVSGATVSFVGTGTCSLTAAASATTDDAAAVGSAQSFTVSPVATVLTLSPSANSSQFGQNVGLTGLVNTGGAIPTGTVSFTSGGTNVGAETVTPVSTTNLVPFSEQIGNPATWIGYCGTTNTTLNTTAVTAPDGSNTATQLVMPNIPGYTCGVDGLGIGYLTSIPGGLVSGTTYTASVWLRGAVGGEVVTFGLSDGFTVSLALTTSWQRYIETATYENDGESTRGFEVIGGGQSDSTFYVWGAQTEATPPPAGPLIRTESTSATGSGGIATFATSSLPVGTDLITAVYSGDTNDQGSTSPAVTVLVTPVTPTVTVSCSPFPATFAVSGLVATCTAEVSGGATGTVTFSGTDVVAPNQTVSSGVATLGGFSGIPPGTYTVTATYNGNADNNSASGSTTLTINPAPQTISFAALANQTFGVAPFAVNASASSGLPVSFASTTTGVCTVSGATVSVVTVGTCTIQATQVGNADFLPATAMTQSFTVSPVTTSTTLLSSVNPSLAGQSVTFTALVNMSAFQQSEAAAPTGSVSFTSGGATLGTGTASPVSTTNLIPDSDFVNGIWTFDNSPITGSDMPIVDGAGPGGANAFVYTGTGSPAGFNVNNTPAISVTAGDTYTLSIFIDPTQVTSGTVVAELTNMGIDSFLCPIVAGVGQPAQRYSATCTIPSGMTQVLVITDPDNATVSSGGKVIWSQPQLEQAAQEGPYVETGTAATSGFGGKATFTTTGLPAGTDPITAVYSGSTNDTGSTSTVLEQVVQQQTQTITFTAPTTPVTFGVSAIGLSATASSGLAVSFSATGPCSVSGATLTITGAGTCTVTASQAGNADFSAAALVSNAITVNAASQTITFTAPTTPVTVGVDPLTLSATASSGLPVAFSVISGPGAISGSSLSITGSGTIVVAANQAGNAGFSAAPQVEQTVVVNVIQPAAPPAAVAVGVVTPYQISLIAGNGTAGFGPIGGAATSAALNGPRDATVDASGNIYISDFSNNVIEKVTPSGVITIFAGTGTAGFQGDGGAATSAELNEPGGTAVDSKGNVYIADFGNNVIRVVNNSGIISTFAGNATAGFSGDGGAATSAELSEPVDVAIDLSGNLYIADRGNNRIRMVSAATGIITTFAGNGTAGFSGDGGSANEAEFSATLQDMAVDSHSNLIITDRGNNRIRMVNTAGIISTVAGNGAAGFSGDGGSATSAELDNPFGVAVNAAGNIYFSDETNSRLRMVNPSGIITTIAGGGAGLVSGGGPAANAELSEPTGLSISSNGTIYFADSGLNIAGSLGPNGALVFSSLPVASTSATQSVTVQNIGAATLTFSAAPTVTGDFAIASGNTCGTSGSTLASGATCSIPVTFSPTDVGTRTGILTLADNGVATSQQVVLTGTATEDTTTTVRLTSSSNPSTFGQAVGFSAAVPSEATGTVQFLNGATSLGSSQVSGGVATISISALPVGTDSITAVYSGDTNFAGATSAAVSQVVQQAIPTISISNIPSPAVFAQSFTPTFTYSGIGSPTESVTSSTTGVCSVSGSTVSFVGVGACTLTAAASATTDDAAAVGSPQTFQVSQVATTTTLSSSLNPSTFGQSVGFTSLVNTGGTTPTGSVSFMNGGTTLGTGTVTPVSTTNLIPDSNFANGLWQFEGGSLANTTLPIVSGAGPAGANAFVFTGNGSPAAFAFNNSPLVSVTPGARYTLSVFIDPSAVTNGTVEAALCTEPGFNCVGNTFVVAGAGQPAQRYSATITIPAGVTQVSVIFDPNLATISNGGRLIFSQPQLEQAAQEGPYIQTGTAATTGFGGSATFSTTNLPVGTDPITAVYSGDTNDTGSTSPLLQQVVNQAMPTISIANIPSGDVVGQSFTPTFTYNGTGTPTKSVASSTPAVCVVSGGTVNFIAAGACTLTASATSTTDDTAVTGSPQSFTIGTSAVNIAAVSTLSTSTYGQIVTWTFTVTGVNGTPVVPTGNISVVLAGTPLATVPLVNGVGTFISGTLPGGKDTIITTYSGDSNFH